jgi:hypothetical protein
MQVYTRPITLRCPYRAATSSRVCRYHTHSIWYSLYFVHMLVWGKGDRGGEDRDIGIWRSIQANVIGTIEHPRGEEGSCYLEVSVSCGDQQEGVALAIPTHTRQTHSSVKKRRQKGVGRAWGMATGAVAIYTIHNHNSCTYLNHIYNYESIHMCYSLPDVWCHWFPAVDALENILHQHVIAQPDLKFSSLKCENLAQDIKWPFETWSGALAVTG